jgi:hypothetical protein
MYHWGRHWVLRWLRLRSHSGKKLIFIIYEAQTKLLIVFDWVSNDHNCSEDGDESCKENHCHGRGRVIEVISIENRPAFCRDNSNVASFYTTIACHPDFRRAVMCHDSSPSFNRLILILPPDPAL